jgi:hypothetical protein
MGRILENLHVLLGPTPKTLEEVTPLLWPNADFQFGYMDRSENLRDLMQEDQQALTSLGLTTQDYADAIERLFACEDDYFEGRLLLRMLYISGPVCPWNDFAAFSPLGGLIPDVREILLLNPEEQKLEEFAEFYTSQKGRISTDHYCHIVEQDWAMIFSEIHAHLIREHSFFEGRKTPYRVDPIRGARYLNLKGG